MGTSPFFKLSYGRMKPFQSYYMISSITILQICRMINKAKLLSKMQLLCFILAIVGITFRMFYCICYPIQPRDSYMYELCIKNWEKTGKIPESFSGIPFSLWLFKTPYHFFHLDILRSGVVINSLLGILILIIAILIADELFRSIYISFVAGLVFATHPMLVRFSCSLLRENLYLFFTMMSVYALIKYYKSAKVVFLVWSSIFASLSFLSRLEGLELLPIFLFVIFTLHKKISLKRCLCHCCIYTCVFLSISICVICSFRSNINYLQAMQSKYSLWFF